MSKKTRKSKNKKYVYLMSIAAVLAAAAMTLFLVTQLRGQSSGGKQSEETTDDASAVSVVGYNRYIVSEGVTEYPIIQTNIEGVFVRLNPNGEFGFYQYTDENALSPYDDVKTVKVTATCSSQDIPAKLYYVDIDGEVAGFGLFTTAISDAKVKLYDYAFFKICTMPDGYGGGDAMLLVDFDKDDFTKAEKSYSEVFSLDLGSGKTTKLTGDNGRLVGKDGRLRTDWAVMTDDLLRSCGGDKLYLSGRNYNLGMMDTSCDVLLINDTSKKPTWVASGLYGTYLKVTENGLVYLKKTENGFESVINKDKTETVITSFTEDKNCYLMSGDWLLNKTSLELINLLTGDRVTLSTDIINPTSFSVSPDGKKAVIFKAGQSNQTVVLCSLDTGAFTVSVGDNLVKPRLEAVSWVGAGKYITQYKADSGDYCYRLCAF